MTRATPLKKPAFRISHCTTSTHEIGRFRGLDGTSARGAVLASSTSAEVGGVGRPEETGTTPFGATTEPPEPKRGQSREAPSTESARTEQAKGRDKQTDGPKDVRTHPASKPSGPEPGTRTAEAWHWPG